MPFGKQHFGEVASDGADSASRAGYQDRSGVWPLRRRHKCWRRQRYASSTRPQRCCAHILSRGYRKNLSSGISWFTFFARLTAAYRQRTPQNPSEPERGMREGKITVLSWECKASHRLGITRKD